MPHSLSHKYPIPISQLCLVNTDVPAGVGAPLNTLRTLTCHYGIHIVFLCLHHRLIQFLIDLFYVVPLWNSALNYIPFASSAVIVSSMLLLIALYVLTQSLLFGEALEIA